MKKHLILILLLITSGIFAQTRRIYQEPSWSPRIFLPYEEVVKGDFCPPSPTVPLTYNDPAFDETRLSKVPAPGIHPRVLITPADLEVIRRKVALGENAPLAFKVMWEREKRKQNAFYALVTRDDKLGKELAGLLVEKLKALEKKLPELESQPDNENLWSVERSIVAQGNPDPPTEIWDLLDYDYLYGWMSNSEREFARQLIARITARRFSNYMMYPDHFMINNHQGFGMEYVRLMLLIEGEKGFNKEIFDRTCHKANAMLSWFLDKDGMCYETIKGWLNISAFTAVGLRQRNLLKHDHLQAKMRFFLSAIHWENGKWMIRDEMRASAFHVIWMMHYFHPKDEKIDFLYQSTFSSHDFLTDANAKWPNPVGITSELLLLYADAGMTDKNGKITDWTQQVNIDKLKLPVTWKDDQRGYVYARNSWRKDDLQFAFACKQDFYYGGHEGSENNRIILWKDGVNWIQDNNMLAAKATFLQNMLTVDGKGCKWPPVAGTWLGVNESAEGLTAAGDGKDGYTYTKSMQVHPFNSPSAKIPYYAPFAEGNFDLSRDIQVAFNPRTIQFNDGFAHTDYGPWSGETRLVEGYRIWNPMKQLYRTVHLAKGKNPYLLVIDDAVKDDQKHLFEWNISVPLDVELVDAITPEIQFQNTNPSEFRNNDIILGKMGMPRDSITGKIKPRKGDPLCLVRVLWRNTDYGFPVPRFEQYQGYKQVVVPAQTVSPEFRILVYPYKHGEPLPKTSWNADRTELIIQTGSKKDVYHFGKTDGGRTVLEMSSDGKSRLTSDAKPARPVMIVRGERFDINDLRYTRDESKVPAYLIDGNENIQFERVVAPAQIRFTLDGSVPTENATLYEKPIRVDKTCELKAIVFNPEWVFGAQKSEVISAKILVKHAVKGLSEAPANNQSGLIARVYEKNTKLYNDKGFFESSRIMMPGFSDEKPILLTKVAGFELPEVTSKQPLEEQTKAFYRFNGYFFASEKGVYKFDVNSCGPVTLNIAGETIIEHIGVFHQQQAHRSGEVVLDKGWHPIELIICDPLFWNINSMEPMPFEVKYAVNGSGYQFIVKKDLCFIENQSFIPEPQLEPKWKEALVEVPKLEAGFIMQQFDQTGRRRSPGFLDVDGLKAFNTQKIQTLESSESRNIVQTYSGYFNAPIEGVYTFNALYDNGEIAFLGSRQANCQNQIRVDNEVVVQHGVFGRNPSGKIGLKAGWHTISIRFGSSETTVMMTLPDNQTIRLNGFTVFRDANSITEQMPLSPPLGTVNFENWNGKTGDYPVKGDFQLWINHEAKITEGSSGRAIAVKSFDPKLAAAVDVNVSRGTMRPGLRVHHLNMRENAMTVALWFKTSEIEGRLFGKDGYNAFGKSYRTISCGIENGRLVARPNTFWGPKIETGKWYLVVLTANETEMKLFLNGEKVATASGTNQITTDALDFFMGHSAETTGFSLWDRALEDDEVKSFYRAKHKSGN
jgi:hypothetical protein